MKDPVEQSIAALFPLDGPHTEQQVIDATRAMGELTRYLNRATLSGRGAALPTPDSVNKTLLGVQEMIGRLDQLLRQLDARLGDLSCEPGFYVTAHADGVDALHLAPRVAAQYVAAQLVATRETLTHAHTQLGMVCEITARMGVDAPPAEG